MKSTDFLRMTQEILKQPRNKLKNKLILPKIKSEILRLT